MNRKKGETPSDNATKGGKNVVESEEGVQDYPFGKSGLIRRSPDLKTTTPTVADAASDLERLMKLEEELLRSSEDEAIIKEVVYTPKTLPRIEEEKTSSRHQLSTPRRSAIGSRSKGDRSPQRINRRVESRLPSRDSKYRGAPRTEYRTRKDDIKNASFIIRKHEEAAKRGKVFSNEELDSFKWAKGTIKKYDDIDIRDASSSSRIRSEAKRDRSLDVSGREHKKFKGDHTQSSSRHEKADGYPRHRPTKLVKLDNLPFNEVLKMDLKVCIVDHGTTDLRISSENHGKVDAALFNALFDWISEHPDSKAPVYDTTERFRGFIVINCDDVASANFLKLAVSRMGSLWSGAKLEVLKLHEIPAMPKIYASIPLFVEGIKVDEQFGIKTLSVLKGQNSDIPMDKWTLTRIGRVTKRSAVMTFALDKESFAVLERKGFQLMFVRNKLTVGFSRGGLVTEEEEKEKEMEEMLVDTDEPRLSDGERQ